MEILHLVLIAIVQGITEFLPVSSSAHLVLLPKLFAWEDQGAMIDLMAHFGSLFAVLIYFRKDVEYMILGGIQILTGRVSNDHAQLLLKIIVATPPVLVIGLVLKLVGLENMLRHLWIIAGSTIFFGLLLGWVDHKATQDKQLKDLSLLGAFWVGVAQALALIPGTSRSGITMTVGLHLGLKREDTAKFAMLMGIPVLFLGGGLAMLDLWTIAAHQLSGNQLRDGVVVAFLSFVSAYFAISLMMKWLKKSGFLPFVIYRLILGAVLLIWMAL